METFDVVQAGYGPAGQALAALPGRRGHRIAVFERQASLYELPRVGGVDHEIIPPGRDARRSLTGGMAAAALSANTGRSVTVPGAGPVPPVGTRPR